MQIDARMPSASCWGTPLGGRFSPSCSKSWPARRCTAMASPRRYPRGGTRRRPTQERRGSV